MTMWTAMTRRRNDSERAPLPWRAIGTRTKIATLSLALWAAAALLVLLLSNGQQWFMSTGWPWWVTLPALAALFALTEIFVVHLRIRADAHTFSLVELPLAIGLYFAQPLVLVVAQLLGAGLALALHRKQGPLKLLFNCAVFASTTIAAVGIFRWLAPHRAPLNQAVLLTGGLALLIEALISVVLVFVVISISAGSWKPADLRAGVGFGLIAAIFTSCLGIITVVVLDAQPGIAWLLIVPTAGTYLANWAYTTQRRRHEGLDFLYQSTQLLHQSSELETAIVDLLRHACDTFNAEAAELIYLTESSEESVCVRVGPGDQVETLHALDPSHQALLGLLASRQASILRQGVIGAGAEFLALSGYRDAIVAPLLGEVRIAGALVIANRLSEVVGFDSTDARLAETLANHTTTALENGRLEQSLEQLRVLEGRLTFQALHDPLTGLANRTLFRTRLQQAIDEQDGGHGAVLFIDLDDFKTVNDSFGHATGDALLIEVAARLKSCVAETDVIARLGGDEFAILLCDVAESVGATAAAHAILRTFDAPAIVTQRRLDIRASVGIALIQFGADPEAMMRNADTAMYMAKAQGKHRVVMFEPSMYESNVHRFNLHSDLQRALDRHELVAHYQPIVRLIDQQLLGAEVLVRWRHPTLGMLSPDSFLPVAEQTGLIVAIDMLMMEQACEWMSRIDVSDPGMVPWVNVNVSPRSFREPTLVDDVTAALRRHRLAPNRLGIEITENLMSEQADRAIETLQRLKTIGLRLALDDFGTGYSSLSYLQSLPVDIVKIAKPFIDDVESSASQRAFTTAIVALGGALDKFVIAEGVERREQLDLLEAVGCDAGQGYYFARPMSQDDFVAWARQWHTRSASSAIGNVSPIRPMRMSRAESAVAR
jgi:diguanylate cyclase (GGDEF)-like protein